MIRFFDLIFSSIAIILLMPLFLIVVAALRVTGEGEIFYLQKRVGLSGKEFNLIKFATMLKDSPKLGTGDITLENDPRVLPFGKLLRITKINELPQLINVFTGEMSLIGPRPLTKKMFLMYKPEVQKLIVKVRPGLSGIGSIIFRDEQVYLKSSEDAEKFYVDNIADYKGQLENWFVKNRSIFLYFYLIFMTILAVLTNRYDNLWRLYPDIPKSQILDIPKS